MKTILLISTYNWAEALELVLLSVKNQTVQPDEIIIADDGSLEDTSYIIKEFNKKSNVKAVHVWHEDKGFRKSIILNKAIAQSKGEYVIQTDGDCILHPNFVEDHIRFAKQDTYLYGSRVTISEDYLQQLFLTKKNKFNIFSEGINNKTRALRIPLFSSFYKPKLVLSKKLRGCNVSYWKKDFIAVNGYNEDMTGWGREDSELMARMINYGVKGRRIRYSGIVYHIWHKIFSKHNLDKNNEIQESAIKKQYKYCNNGVEKYLKPINK